MSRMRSKPVRRCTLPPDHGGVCEVHQAGIARPACGLPIGTDTPRVTIAPWDEEEQRKFIVPPAPRVLVAAAGGLGCFEVWNHPANEWTEVPDREAADALLRTLYGDCDDTTRPVVGSRWLHGEDTSPVYTVVGLAELHTAEAPLWDLQPMVVYTSSSPAAEGRWSTRTVEEWQERFRPEAVAPAEEPASGADGDCDDADGDGNPDNWAEGDVDPHPDESVSEYAKRVKAERKAVDADGDGCDDEGGPEVVRRPHIEPVTRAEFDELAADVKSLTSGAFTDVMNINRTLRTVNELAARIAVLEERTRPLGPIAEPQGEHVEHVKARAAIVKWIRECWAPDFRVLADEIEQRMYLPKERR